MRLRDAIDAEDGVANQRERNFLWTSHLDFVAVDVDTQLPELAIEYDGPLHASDPEQAARDRVKDKLCERAGLPLLRIDNLFTRKQGRWRVLNYILDAHENGKAFYEAQKEGSIPDDEPFYHGSILTRTADGCGFQFTGLDISALQFLNEFRQRHGVLWDATWQRDGEHEVETRSMMAMPNGQFLYARYSARRFAILGISAWEISDELATAEMGWLARRYAGGEGVALNATQGAALLDEIRADEHGLRTSSGWAFRHGYGKGPAH